MLVLQRRAKECMVIPALGIRIVVVEVRGNKAKIGVEAPDHIKIYREEIWEEMVQRELATAAAESRSTSGDTSGDTSGNKVHEVQP